MVNNLEKKFYFKRCHDAHQIDQPNVLNAKTYVVGAKNHFFSEIKSGQTGKKNDRPNFVFIISSSRGGGGATTPHTMSIPAATPVSTLLGAVVFAVPMIRKCDLQLCAGCRSGQLGCRSVSRAATLCSHVLWCACWAGGHHLVVCGVGLGRVCNVSSVVCVVRKHAHVQTP